MKSGRRHKDLCVASFPAIVLKSSVTTIYCLASPPLLPAGDGGGAVPGLWLPLLLRRGHPARVRGGRPRHVRPRQQGGDTC